LLGLVCLVAIAFRCRSLWFRSLLVLFLWTPAKESRAQTKRINQNQNTVLELEIKRGCGKRRGSKEKRGINQCGVHKPTTVLRHQCTRLLEWISQTKQTAEHAQQNQERTSTTNKSRHTVESKSKGPATKSNRDQTNQPQQTHNRNTQQAAKPTQNKTNTNKSTRKIKQKIRLKQSTQTRMQDKFTNWRNKQTRNRGSKSQTMCSGQEIHKPGCSSDKSRTKRSTTQQSTTQQHRHIKENKTSVDTPTKEYLQAGQTNVAQFYLQPGFNSQTQIANIGTIFYAHFGGISLMFIIHHQLHPHLQKQTTKHLQGNNALWTSVKANTVDPPQSSLMILQNRRTF